MKRFAMGVLTTVIIGAAVGAAVVYAGLFDVAADAPHSSLVYRLIETTRENSIDRRAAGLAVPGDLTDTDRIRRGAGNYDAMCISCHLAPGKGDTEIRKGLYPMPPDLTQADETGAKAAARQFWIIKHGIKASGMPAWSKGGMEDNAIWDLVSFVQRMPALSADQYLALVESSDGHSHGGVSDMKDIQIEGMPAGIAKPRVHDNSDGHAH